MTTTRERNASKQYRNAETRSVDAERRTVEIVWSTGAAVLRRDVFGSFWEELSLNPEHVRLERLNNRAPFLANHNQADVRQVLGVVVPGSAKVDGKLGTATIRFSKAGIDPEADKVFEKIRDGILTKVSVGYATHVEEEMEPDAKGIPTLRATDWEPFEISSVAVGADDGATFRSTPNQPERKRMEPEVKTPAEEVDIVKRERERAHAINHAVRVANLDPSYAADLIRANVPVEVARERVLAAMEARSAEINPTPGRADIESDQRPIVTIGDVPEDHFVRGASAWLLEKTGRRDLVRRAKENKVEGFELVELDGGRFRGMSMLDLAKEALRLEGAAPRGDSMRIMGEALRGRSGGWLQRNGVGAQGTGHFPKLLENTLGKILLASLAATPTTWERFCKTESVDDFKTASRLRVGAFGELKEVPEGAEYTNVGIPDAAKIEISTKTHGRVISITRQALVNDDLGAFANMAQQLGLMSARTIEKAVYEMLLQNSGLGPTMGDGNPFFHSSRGNVNGTGSALTVAGLDADRLVLGAQKDVNNVDTLDLKPKVLLVPANLGGTAKVLVNAQFDPDATGQLQRPNMVNGIVRDVLDTARLAGTRRYLFASPDELPAFVVVFLQGQRSPQLETHDDFRTDAMSWKIRHDFDVKPFDPRGAVTNAGA